jgi:hypothetical protein
VNPTDHLLVLLAFLGGALVLARFYRYMVDVPEEREPEPVDEYIAELQRERKRRALREANRWPR